MLDYLLEKKRIVFIIIAVIISILLLASFFGGDNQTPKKKTSTPTTTTTLPEKNAQACEYLKEEALAAGGIIPDVKPKTSDKKKRCTYEDIGDEVNYITLYVDVINQCQVLLEGIKESSPIDEVASGAIYSEETDPTIVVPLGARCFFVQGSKTIVTKRSLTLIAQTITQLFKAVDASTTTTTSTTVILPETQLTLPGQNTATTTTTVAPAT